jgi:RNA-directed DNA polymerase
VLEGDIKSCFDEINHEWLLRHIPMEKVVLRQWLKAGFMEGGKLYPTRAGTPQGGIISPVLANMTLDGLEGVIDKHWGKKGTRKRKQCGVHLIRYADDFIITGKTKESLETKVKPAIEEFLSERGLTLSAEKTVITHITQGFDFLGQNVRKHTSKLIIKPSRKSITGLLHRVKTVTRQKRAATQEQLIKQLNPLIRGWANYHRVVCSRKVFEKVDHEIFVSLWQWAKRRHPNKGLQWVKEKYFKTKQHRKWCFGTTTEHNGQQRWQELFKATDVPIRYHRKLRGEANPFDKQWYAYFKERQDTKIKRKLNLEKEDVMSLNCAN